MALNNPNTKSSKVKRFEFTFERDDYLLTTMVNNQLTATIVAEVVILCDVTNNIIQELTITDLTLNGKTLNPKKQSFYWNQIYNFIEDAIYDNFNCEEESELSQIDHYYNEYKEREE